MKKAAGARPAPEAEAVKRGMDLFNARRYDEAREVLESALALNPKSSSAVLSLARLHLSCGDSTRAEAFLRKAVALKAGPEASLLLGELLKGRGEAAKARPHLKRAAADKPRTDDAQVLLAAGLTRFRANVELGAFGEAFREADALLAAQGTQECLDSFFISPASADAMKVLERLKAFSLANPKNPWPRYFRATVLSNIGRGEEAVAETERLAESAPRHHWMRHKHGEILLTNRRDYPAAEVEYAAALKCVPGFWKARAALAEIALCRGDAARAVRLWEELIATAPERTKSWGSAGLGKHLLWTGEYEKALVHLDLAVAATVPYSRRHRGAAKLLLGRLDEAAADLEESLREDAGAEGLTWRGELRRLRGDFKGAVEDLNAAIRMDCTNSIWALANRALAYGASGDAARLKSDYAMIRRDVIERFELEADEAGPAAVLEAGLRLGRGVRVANEYLFPVWMGHGKKA